MSRAPHATPHAHTRAHTPSHARPFSPAASRACESQDGRGRVLRGPHRPPQGLPRGAVGGLSSVPPTSGPSTPVLPHPPLPAPMAWALQGQVGAAVALACPVEEIWEGCLSSWRVHVGPSTRVCAHTCVGVPSQGFLKEQLVGRRVGPRPGPHQLCCAGQVMQVPWGLEGVGQGEEAGAARPEPGVGPGHSTAWPGGPGAVAGGGGHWAGEPCGHAPPHWSAVRRGHSPGASLWLGALTGATGGPGEPSRLPLHGRPGAPFRREGGMRAPSSDTQRPPHRTGRGSPRGPSFRLPVRSPGQGPGGQEGRGEPRGCAAAPSPPWEAVRVRRPLPRPGPQMAGPGVSKNSC